MRAPNHVSNAPKALTDKDVFPLELLYSLADLHLIIIHVRRVDVPDIM